MFALFAYSTRRLRFPSDPGGRDMLPSSGFSVNSGQGPRHLLLYEDRMEWTKSWDQVVVGSWYVLRVSEYE